MSNGREVIGGIFGLFFAAFILFLIAANTKIPELQQSAQNMGNLALFGGIVVIVIIVILLIMIFVARRQ